MAVYRSPDLDAFHWQGAVKDKDLNSPPGSPAKGDRYIVGPSPSGDWAGHAGEITYYSGSAWVFLALKEGLACWVEDEDKIYAHSGSAWNEVGGGGGGLGYAITVVSASGYSPPDGVVAYFGSRVVIPDGNTGTKKIMILKGGTIKAAFILWVAVGAAGSGENISMYIRKNNSSDTLIATIGNTAAQKEFYNTSLNIAVAQGDYIEIKLAGPAWATNPTGVSLGGQIYVE